MAANQWQNSSLISKEFLTRLRNTMAFTMSVNRQYNNLFQGQGTKPGTTINLRKPSYLSGGRGQAITPEAIVDNVVPLTINTQYHQAVAISAQEEALNLQDYGEQIVQPAVDIIANMIDSDGLALYYEIPRYVGTPATNPTANQTYIDAGTGLSDEAVPSKNRFVVLNPKMQGGILNTQATQFNPSPDINEQNREGTMGRAWGLNFGMDQNVASHTVGALGGTPLVNGTTTEGATSVVTDGWSNSITGVLKKGDIITLANVNAVNPSSKINTGSLRQFTVTADVDSDGSGNATVPIYPAIRATGPNQTVNALPADNAVILIFGHASSHADAVSPQGIAYHKDFATFATVDLYVPRGVEMGSRAFSEDLQLSVRHIRFYDGRLDQLVDRFDVLGGWKVLRPEMAVRVVG